MEQLLPALEGRLRSFQRHAALLAARHPRLAAHLGPPGAAPDAHVDRLVQGVATLHARTALALQRGRWQQDEHLLALHFPQQLRPFPACRIGPAADVPPVNIRAARFCGAPSPAIELELEWALPPGGRHLDIFLDADAAFSASLRAALLGAFALGQAASARPGADAWASATAPGAGWRQLPAWPLTACGLAPEEALLPRPAGDHAGLALLREFFVFPARFNLVRLDLQPFAGAGRWNLRLPMPALRGGDHSASLLAALAPNHLRAGWTASACLLRTAAAPVALDGRQPEYPLSIPPELEIFSIDRVRTCGGDAGWVARRVPAAAPGQEWRIAFRERWPEGSVASIDVSCCRRADVLARPVRGAGSRWQLNSLLALDKLPQDAAALRELMSTQAIKCTPEAQAMIGAVHRLTGHPVLLMPGRAAPLAGTELRLHIEEAAFAGCGIHLFAQVMDRFFGECAHMNTFTRLVLLSARTGEELIRCKARNAGTVLE